MSQITTAAALTGLASGDAQASWTILVERHGGDVWRLVSSRLRDAHETEDAYQEFWLNLPRLAASFTPDADDPEGRKARAWMLRVAYNAATDRLRRRRPLRELAEDQAETGDATVDHDAHAEQQRLIGRVNQAIGELPEGYRRPVLLHVVGGLTYEDLAADLRCTVNNARVKVHRGLKRLREILGVDGEGLSDQTLAGMLVPPLLMPVLPSVPPPPAALAAGAAPASAATGPLAVFSQLPVLIATGTVLAVAATTVAIVATRPSPAPSGESMSITRPVAATVLAVGALAAATIDDFERPSPQMKATGEQQIGGELSMVPAPEGTGAGSGQAMRYAWPSPHGKWVECSYDPARPVLAVTASEAQVVTFKLWAEGFCGVNSISVRFTDSKGETFQWRTPMPTPERTGWRLISVPIDWAKPSGHWHGNSDGVIDFPVRYQGYAFEFASLQVPASAIVLDDLAIVPAAKP
jgi:RNA polymerase sigma factor (sigma-70 family)